MARSISNFGWRVFPEFNSVASVGGARVCSFALEPSNTKFLIVENDPNDAFLIRRALKAAHCGTSFVCRNASEAKAYLKGAGMYADRANYPLPDLILTDLNMEEESGIELVDWIRHQNSPLRDKIVIILSGSASPLQMDAAETVGAQKVYRKPNKLAELELLLGAIAKEFCSAK